MQKRIIQQIDAHLQTVRDISSDTQLIQNVEKSIELLIQCFKADNKVLLCGNGGSAADAEHLAAELSGKFKLNRKALFAEALHVNGAALTAIANDFSFSQVFERMVEAKTKSGDTLIAFSTSGQSQNVIKAIKKALDNQCNIISFSGLTADLGQYHRGIHFKIPSSDTARIQEMYMMICHIICEELEKNLFDNEEDA